MNYLILTLQFIAIVLNILGIYIEYIYEADIGFICITAGGLLFGLFTKIRELQLTHENITLKKRTGL